MKKKQQRQYQLVMSYPPKIMNQSIDLSLRFTENNWLIRNQSQKQFNSINLQKQRLRQRKIKTIFLQNHIPQFLRQKKTKQKLPIELKKINIKQFQIGQLLGRGGNASVYIVRHQPTGSFYAMKKYFKRKLLDKLDQFINSLKIQIFINNPNIAKVYGIIDNQDQICLIMQLCVDGDLTHRLKKIDKRQQNIKQIIRGISRGLYYLHHQNILHRDIKLENILMCYNMPKITDFDLSISLSNALQSRKTFCGSPAYYCPQMIQKNPYTSKIDIWCFGVLCYQLICGYYPFNVNNMQQLLNIVNQPIKQYPLNIDQYAKNFIQIILVKNPHQRAGWKKILKHSYLLK